MLWGGFTLDGLVTFVLPDIYGIPNSIHQALPYLVDFKAP